LGQVLSLPVQVKQEIERQQDIDYDIYLKWMPSVQEAFNTLNLSGNIASFHNPISEVTLHGLEFCADLLSRQAPEKELPRDQLSQLDQKVTELIDEILAAEIDPYLKRYMLDKLNLVLQAIQEYKISGIVPLVKAFEATVGSVVVDRDIYEKTKKTKTGSKFWSVMAHVAIVVNIVVGAIQIGDKVVNLLPEKIEIQTHAEPARTPILQEKDEKAPTRKA